jgi:hypothetical protein
MPVPSQEGKMDQERMMAQEGTIDKDLSGTLQHLVLFTPALTEAGRIPTGDG